MYMLYSTRLLWATAWRHCRNRSNSTLQQSALYIHLEFAKWQQYKNTNNNSQTTNRQKKQKQKQSKQFLGK